MADRPSPTRHIVRFGTFEVDLGSGELRKAGIRIPLQEQPFRVLEQLLLRPGQVVTRDDLRRGLWPGNTFVDFEHGLNAAIKRLRDALGDSADTPRFVETVPRRGYRFIAPVDAPVDPASAVAPVPTDGPRPAGRRIEAATKRRRLRLAPIIGAAVVALTVFTLWRGDVIPRRTTPDAGIGVPGDADASDSSRVAVALFQNGTGEKALEYLSRLATDGIIRALAQVSDVEVMPDAIAATATGTGGASSSPAAIAAGAVLLVTGVYYLHQDGLEFHARIHEASSGRLLHAAEPVTGPVSASAEALRQLERAIAGAVAIHFDDFFGGLHVVSQPPAIQAYREYRLGLEIFDSDYPRALAHLTQAIELEPRFWLPLVMMHFAHGNLGHDAEAESLLTRLEGESGRLGPAERLWIEYLRASWEGRLAQSLRLLEDLERLVPRSLGVNYNLVEMAVKLNRPKQALEAFERLRPTRRSLRHGIGTYRLTLVSHALHMLGDYQRELAVIEEAQRYAPGVLVFSTGEARALAGLGRVDDVTRVIDESLSFAPTSGNPGDVMVMAANELRAHGHPEAGREAAARAVDWYRTRLPAAAEPAARAQLARALYLAERWADAEQMFSALAAEQPGELEYVGYLGMIAARRGDAEQAREMLEALERPEWSGLPAARAAWFRACTMAVLGERQRAVELLREAFGQGAPYGIYVHHAAELEGLRDYPPFVALVAPKE